jgi:hypothetical protein
VSAAARATRLPESRAAAASAPNTAPIRKPVEATDKVMPAASSIATPQPRGPKPMSSKYDMGFEPGGSGPGGLGAPLACARDRQAINRAA